MNKIIDITKPIVDAFGAPVKLIASGLTGEIPGLGGPYYEGGETLLIDDDGELRYVHPTGELCKGGGIDYKNAPERTSEFRNFSSHGTGGVLKNMTFGGCSFGSLQRARECSFINGEGILEIIREGDKLVDVKFHPNA